MKGFERQNKLLSLCGLNCGLCPLFLNKNCPGCRHKISGRKLFNGKYCPKFGDKWNADCRMDNMILILGAEGLKTT